MEKKISIKKYAEKKKAARELAAGKQSENKKNKKGSKADPVLKNGKAEKSERSEKPVKSVKSGKSVKSDKSEKFDRFDKFDKFDKAQERSYKDYRLDDDVQINSNENRIEGRNAVTEAFRSGKTIDRLYVLDGCQDGAVLTIKREATKAGTPIKYLTRQRLDQMSETGKHQGVIAVMAAYHYYDIEDLFARAEEKGEDPFFILLDNIEDPHNLGAIIRTANVVGAHGVIIPKDRAVGLTATVAKASAGAINYTPVAKVTNLSDTIEKLKERGLWFVCADMDGTPMTKLNLTGPVGLVIGAEGEGVSRLVREKCDIIASIPQKGEINSLNASVAMGVLSYEILRQRG